MKLDKVFWRRILRVVERAADLTDEGTSWPLRTLMRSAAVISLLDKEFLDADDIFSYAQETLGAKELTLRPVTPFVRNVLKDKGVPMKVVWSNRVFSALFVVEEYTLPNGADLLVLVHSDQGRISFLSKSYSRSSEEEVCDGIAMVFWGQVGAELSIDVEAEGAGTKPVIMKMELGEREYIGKYSGEELYRYWKRCAEAGLSRSFFFLGVPGTGKTTVGLDIARRAGGRVLRVLSRAIEDYLSPHRMVKLISVLRPDVLLLDDIHTLPRAMMNDVLYMMEWINDTMPTGTLVIATANRLSTVDVALRRPGRFDDAFLFDLPDEDERIEVFEFYAKKYDCEEALAQRLDDLVERTKNASPAYLLEIVKVISVFKDEEVFLDDIIDRKISVMEVLLSKDATPGPEEDARLRMRVPKNGSSQVGFRVD